MNIHTPINAVATALIVDPYHLTHLVSFPCGRKPEYAEESNDFWQSVDEYSFHTRTAFESVGLRSHN